MTFSKTIRTIFDGLVQGGGNTSSLQADTLFKELVHAVTSSPTAEHDLTDEEVSRLRLMNAKREFAFEKDWAERVIAAEDPQAELAKFPYMKNYIQLAALEWSELQQCRTHGDHRVLFCGGGPLPLTAIALAQSFGVHASVIDNDATAVAISRKLVERLDLAGMISIAHADAQHYPSYGRYTVVFVAALAGLASGEKERIFKRINDASEDGTHVIARSGSGNRTLLYCPLGEEVLRYMTPVRKTERCAEVNNHHYFVTVEIMKTHGWSKCPSWDKMTA